ncbi:MAG: putative quinol monooxygenase [Actinomycetota bacterium]|nr:putative quinol monooxygenase [Actinomycetota bacterium]
MGDPVNIVVNAVLEADEETIAVLKQPILTMQEASRAEDGCLDYTFSIELGDPEVIRITERWATMAALEAHFDTPHMAVFLKAMAANPPKGSRISVFEATEVPRPGS